MKSIKHNTGERNTPKNRALLQEVGIIGFGIYWYILEEITEGNVLELNDEFFNIYSSVFKVSEKELKNSIDTLLRLNIFILEKNMFTTKERQEIKQKRAEYGRKGMQERWGEKIKIKKPDSFIEQKPNRLETENFETEPTGDKLAELIKKAVSSRPVMPEVKKVIEEVKQDLQKIKPTRKKKPIAQDLGIIVSSTDFAELEKMSIKKPFKEVDFLPLFNRLKKELKPNSKGHIALTPTDKTNLKRLINVGYTEEDFIKVINTAFKNDWVKTNSMDIPTHVLRNENFERYLNKSQKDEAQEFKVNPTDKPIYK